MLPDAQRGMAILLAMLVLAMAAIAAAGFIFRTSLEWRKFENASSLGQARWVLRAAENWAGAVLRDDQRQSSVDHRGELWARELPPVDSEGYAVSGGIQDMDGRFNLNNLLRDGVVDAPQLAILRRLLANLELPDDLADDVADWMDADSVTLRDQSPESAYYLALDPPVVPSDRPLATVDELIRVRGVDAAVLDRLRPHVATLPERTGINVNTATPEVLAALVDGLTTEQADTLASRRDRTYFRDVADFNQALPVGMSPVADMARVDSRYFLVTARARHDRVDIGSRALLRRDGEKTPVLVWRASL